MLKKQRLDFFIALILATGSASAASLALSPVISGQIRHDGLSTDQTRELLVVMLKHEKLFISKPGFSIETVRLIPGYINFHVTWDSPKAAATDVIGEFAVSPLTGDIWEINNCKRYSFTQLSQLQAEITKHTGKTFTDESTVRQGMGCK